MALSTTNSLLPTKSFKVQSLPPPFKSPPTTVAAATSGNRFTQPILSVHSSDPSKPPIEKSPKPQSPATAAATTAAPKTADPTKWVVDSWKTKKAIQLPEYPDQSELDSVLQTLDSFPPIVFAGEARHLEERLADAAMGNAFLLQCGDCAYTFKEFNANNIRDTMEVERWRSAVEIGGDCAGDGGQR